MPRAAGTRRIEDREWNTHKAEIVRLYERHTLLGDNGVIMTMARRGFTATRAQYETRLRNWGVHKYRKAGRIPRPRRETAEPHQEAESGL
ncbi:hypothetical protein HD806DRAFT_515886 [Xylariaceae sp. AK1471]|nr:hypothetical protein HD806DRAFT_515886 [Xylariaceae sp. AK1471]